MKISFLIFSLFFSYAKAENRAEMKVEGDVNCPLLLEKVRLNDDFYTQLMFLSDYSLQKFKVWQRSQFRSQRKRRSYERVMAEMNDVLLLANFNDASYIRQRNISLRLTWALTTPLVYSKTKIQVPGFKFLSVENIDLIENLLVQVDEGRLTLKVLVNPLSYCLQENLVISDGVTTLLGEYPSGKIQ